jgi:hypothetical protein
MNDDHNDRWFWIGLALAVAATVLGFLTLLLALSVGYVPM